MQACVEFLDVRVATAGQPDVKPAAGQPGRITITVDALAVALQLLNLQLAKGVLPTDLASQVCCTRWGQCGPQVAFNVCFGHLICWGWRVLGG